MSQLIDVDQQTVDWFAARLGRATASRFSDVLAKTKTGPGAARKNYAAELMAERLTGKQAESYTNGAMEWGNTYEPTARLEYTLATGNEVGETGFWIHDTLMAGASPDGLVSFDGLLEIKCPNTATHIETLRAKGLPKQYQAQVQGQMWITGRLWCDFVSYDPRLPANAQMIIVHVERDDEYITSLEKEVTAFLEEVEQLVSFVKEYR